MKKYIETTARREEFIFLDSSMNSIKGESLYGRVVRLVRRTSQSFAYLRRVRAVVAFSSSHWSMMDKLVTLFFFKMAGRKTLFFGRSGNVIYHKKSFDFVVGILFKKVDVVLCQSLFWKNYYHDNYNISPEKLVVIENWMLGDIRPLEGINPYRIVFFNRIERHKGVYEFLNVAKYCIENGFGYKFEIYGDGSELVNVKKFIQDNSLYNTMCYGFVENLDGELCFQFFTSQTEGYPNALITAMAFNKVPLAIKSEILDGIINDGYDGYLLDNHHDALPQVLLHAIEKVDELRMLAMRENMKIRLESRNSCSNIDFLMQFV